MDCHLALATDSRGEIFRLEQRAFNKEDERTDVFFVHRVTNLGKINHV